MFRVKPAFEGAKFDKKGCCVKHDSVQIAEEIMLDRRLVWKELKVNCPKCTSEHHRSRRTTSLNSTKVKRGRAVHGQTNPLRDTSRGRHMDRQFDTPWDDAGNCHHHPQVKLASKKVRGGWKVYLKACPRCIEAKYDEDAQSVSSRVSKGSRGSKSSVKKSVSTRNTAVKPDGKFDKNGCCVRHVYIQIAKKKLLGGWKSFRDCPKCDDPDYDHLNDNASATSKRSTASRKSNRSAKSGRSGGGRGGGKNARYGALPFDGEGYCHAHPSVRLAKKKTLGGWKVVHDICPDCARDAGSDAGSRASSSRKSGTGRVFDESSVHSSSVSSSKRKTKISVRDMKYRDDDGRDGRYSGYVNEDHRPHGEGKMKYKDGTTYKGVWSEGSQVHGKTARSAASSSRKSSSSDWARRDGGGGGAGNAKTVRKMKWMDYYGDPGVYTGEVNHSNMPHGRGGMKYDHGLLQEGLWNKGQFVEGSDVDAPAETNEVSAQRTAQQTLSERRRTDGVPVDRMRSNSGPRAPRASAQRGLDP